jgi:hypothetical protein
MEVKSARDAGASGDIDIQQVRAFADAEETKRHWRYRRRYRVAGTLEIQVRKSGRCR